MCMFGYVQDYCVVFLFERNTRINTDDVPNRRPKKTPIESKTTKNPCNGSSVINALIVFAMFAHKETSGRLVLFMVMLFIIRCHYKKLSTPPHFPQKTLDRS